MTEPIQTAATAQRIIQDSSQLWNILLYLLWPAIMGSYAFTWRFVMWLRSDIQGATKIALDAVALAKLVRDNELKHIEKRLNILESRK